MASLNPYKGEWAELPRESLLDGALTRTAVRTDGSLVVFNWMRANLPSLAPHSHPFDQLALFASGRVELEIEGEVFDVRSGEFVYIPAGAEHTARVIGEETVLNIDIFSPPRKDYLHLAAHQPQGG